MNQAFIGLGINRENIYIANIVKCRPPNNRTPLKEEANACLDYLRKQVLIVKPKIIVLMGSTALKNILGEEYGITASRGRWIEKKGIKYMPTFHPAALLRDETKKIDFYNDLKYYLDLLNEELSLNNNLDDISNMINICINMLELLDLLLIDFNTPDI